MFWDLWGRQSRGVWCFDNSDVCQQFLSILTTKHGIVIQNCILDCCTNSNWCIVYFFGKTCHPEVRVVVRHELIWPVSLCWILHVDDCGALTMQLLFSAFPAVSRLSAQSDKILLQLWCTINLVVHTIDCHSQWWAQSDVLLSFFAFRNLVFLGFTILRKWSESIYLTYSSK